MGLDDVRHCAPRLAVNRGWLSLIRAAEYDDRPDVSFDISYSDVKRVAPDYPRTSFRRNLERVRRGVYRVRAPYHIASGVTNGEVEHLQATVDAQIKFGPPKQREPVPNVDTSGAVDEYGSPAWAFQDLDRAETTRVRKNTGLQIVARGLPRCPDIHPGRAYTTVSELAELFETSHEHVKAVLTATFGSLEQEIPVCTIAARPDITRQLSKIDKPVHFFCTKCQKLVQKCNHVYREPQSGGVSFYI